MIRQKSIVATLIRVTTMLALALYAFVPAGLMPGRVGANSSFALVLCDGHGPMEMTASHGHHSSKSTMPSDSDSKMTCPFAGHGGGVAAHDIKAPLPAERLLYILVEKAAPDPDWRYIQRLAAPPPYPQGPPSQPA